MPMRLISEAIKYIRMYYLSKRYNLDLGINKKRNDPNWSHCVFTFIK